LTQGMNPQEALPCNPWGSWLCGIRVYTHL
jgi:hypothetical protein